LGWEQWSNKSLGGYHKLQYISRQYYVGTGYDRRRETDVDFRSQISESLLSLSPNETVRSSTYQNKNIPIYDSPGSSQLPRNSVDECFNYVIGMIDESIPNLMDDITAVNSETGRITKIVAKAMKAEILVYAASPLQVEMLVRKLLLKTAMEELFNHTYSAEKWQLAAKACKEAIDFATEHGKKLHTWTPTGGFTPQAGTQFQMNIREAYNENTDNPEVLWLDTKSTANGTIQGYFMLPRYTANATSGTLLGFMSATINIVEKFYSNNGVPIEEDITYPYTSRFDLITVPNTDAYKYDLVAGKQTARMNLNRENRFYGTLMFDAGRVFMLQAGSDANAYNIDLKYSGSSGKVDPTRFNWTGYASKNIIIIEVQLVQVMHILRGYLAIRSCV
jgi:hypothetical protein